MSDPRRFFLWAKFKPGWTEVSREAWIGAERSAGFRPTGNWELATGGFSAGEITGTYTTDGNEPSWNPGAADG